MHVTFWPSLTAMQGASADITWEELRAFVAEATVNPVRGSLQGWSAARFKGNQRGIAFLEEVSAVVLDIDRGGKTVDDLRSVFAGPEGLVHSSHSHNPASGTLKWRVVLRTSRAMTRDEYARVWSVVAAQVAERGVELDQATKDGSRFWFVPARRAVDAPYEWTDLPGAPIDVDAILAAAPVPQSIAPAPRSSVPSPSAVSGPNAAAALALGRAWPPDGQRNEAHMALAGALRCERFSEADALEFMHHVYAVAGDPENTKHASIIERTYARPADAPTVGWTRLAQYVPEIIVNAVRQKLSGMDVWDAKDEEVRARVTAREAEAGAVSLPMSMSPGASLPPVGRLTPAQRAMRLVGRDVTRLRTGLPSLDVATRGGVLLRKVAVIGGAPGAGKTALLVRMAYTWLSQGVPVGILASDEDADGLLTRLGQLHGLSRDALERGDPAASRTLADWCESVPLLLVDGDEDGGSIESLSRELRTLANGRSSAMLVDSIQTARSEAQTPTGTDARAKIDAIVRALKHSAKVDGHLVAASSELSRAAYRNKDAAENANALAAFKESGGIEYGVSLAVVLSSRQGTSELVDAAVVKNRLGPGKPEFMLRLDHDRADVRETTAQDAKAVDPLYFVKHEIKAALEKACGTPVSKRQLAERVGGRTATAFRAIDELLDARELHQEQRGIRFPLPGDPGYVERIAS